MKVRDFEHRFEETLKSNGLSYTLTEKSEEAAGFVWSYKNFSIAPRCSYEIPLLVTLIKTKHPVGYRRLGKTTATCFVVKPSWSGNGKGVEHGLIKIWSTIKIQCMPL